MQSRRPSGLAIAPPLLHRRSSLLSLDTAASPHTPRSCASALPPPDLYLQPTISKRTSTTSWNSSNADEMDFDWKQDQVLLLSRTLDALPAHLVTPFNGPIPPSNLLDKIARGVSQAKGPLDWPHSIRATRVKLIELARARAKDKDDAKKKEQPQLLPKVVVGADPASRYDYFDDAPHQNRLHPDDGPQRRPLYKQSSMDFITPEPAEIKDNPTIAQLSNRLQRTERAFPTPTSYHPYNKAAPSRIAVRTRPAPLSHSQAAADSRSASPPRASDVPDLIVPNPNSLSNSSSNSSFGSDSAFLSASASLSGPGCGPSSAAAAALRPHLVRRSTSTLSSSSMYSSSSGNSGHGMALQDKRLQRVRRADSFTGAPLNSAPAPPPKDYPSKQPVVAGMKRAPSYGALAQGVRREGKMKNENENAFRRAMRGVIAQEGGEDGKAKKRDGEKERDKENDKDKEKDKENEQQRHGRQLSGSYPSSDEEEKARSKRAKKLRGAAASATHPKQPTGVHVGSPGGVVPPSPSVASLSSSTSAESLSLSASTSAPGTPMVLVTTAPSTPTGVGAPTPPAKDRFLASPRTPSRLPMSRTRALLKAVPTVIVGSPERVERVERVSPPSETKSASSKANTKATGRVNERASARAPKPYLYSVPETGKDHINAVHASPTANSNATNNKRPSAPKMNAQRNPSMFGMELPRLSSISSASVPFFGAPVAASTTSKHKHTRTLSRESAGTASSAGTGTTTSSARTNMSGPVGLPPLCGDAVLSVPPSPLTLGSGLGSGFGLSFAQDRDGARRVPAQHGKRASEGSSGGGARVPSSPAPTRALSPAPTLAAAMTTSPTPASPQRVKTLRRVRNRLAPVPARRISFGSLLASTDDMDAGMSMDVDGDDRSFDLSGGRMGSGMGSELGLGMGLGSGLGLGFGADDRKQNDSGGGSVFGAVLGEAFSVQPRAVPERTPKRERERERASKERKERNNSLKEGLGGGALGSAFRMA